MCGLYLASSNNPRKMSSYTLTPNAYLMQESIQTLRFIRSEMIWIQIILIEMQIRRDMKMERYWLKFTNWHKLCHIVDSVPFFTSVQNSVFKCWIRSTAITYVQQIKTCMKSFRFVPLSKHFCLEWRSEDGAILLRTHIRQERSEYTLFSMLVRARQAPLTVTVLALTLHTFKGMR